MPTQTQNRILDDIAKRVARTPAQADDGHRLAAKLTLIVDYNLANTGILGAVRPGDLVSPTRYGFDFQMTYATFTPVGESNLSRQRIHLDFEKGPAEVAAKVALLVDRLTAEVGYHSARRSA